MKHFVVHPLVQSPPSAGHVIFYTQGTSVIAWDANGYAGTVVFGSDSIVKFDGTAYRVTKEDNGKLIYFTSASAVTVTVDNSLPDGFNCGFERYGTGSVTFTGSGVTLNSMDGLLSIAAQYGTATLYRRPNGTLNLTGALA